MNILMVVYDNDSYISTFPIGLAYLASVARRAGHSISIYQQDIYHYPDEHLTAYLNKNSFDIVMISVIGGYYQYKKLKSLSNAINSSRDRNKFKYLIGGHGPASDPEFFLRKTKADFVGIGEGEITIVELLDAIENNKDLSKVNGIAFIDKNDKYILTQKRALIKDIDNIPMPAYDLFDISHYSLLRLPNIKPRERSMAMLSGRGCTFACNFCYRMDKGFRPRSSQGIIEEIKYLKDTYNISRITFFDDLLMNSKQRTIELCEAFINAKLNITWDCNGRLNYAEPHVLKKMKEAGCVFINYGIESLDNATLKVMHKGLTREMIIKGVETTLQVGISPGLNLIYGNINEPISAIDDAVEFLLKYDDHAQLRTIRPVTPYPGCELFDYAIDKGLVKDTEDFYENKHTNSDLLSINFTKHSEEEIYKALHKANTRLIEQHINHSKKAINNTCDDLYFNKNAAFRGFRTT